MEPQLHPRSPRTAGAGRAARGHDPDDAVFRAAFDGNPLGMAVVERDDAGAYTILDVNPAMTAIYGWAVNERSDREMGHLLAEPDTLAFHPDGWRERRHRDVDGHEIWTRWHVAPIPAPPDGPTRLLVQVDLITDRVKARLRAQRQSRLLDLIPEPVIIRALDGTVLYWNSGASEIYGHSAEHAVGRRTHDLLQTEFVGVTLPELEAQLATAGTWSGQLEHRHADGRVLHMMSKHVRDDHGDGQPVILEINIDITDRLAAERALAASEAKFRSQFVHSTVGQLIRRMDGTIEEVNQALADMLGYRPAELIGTRADRLFTSSTTAVRADALAAMRSGEVEAMTAEVTMIRVDGSLLDIEANVSVARAADGTVERIIGFFQDITDRKRAADALTHRASHDPLTGLVNRTLLLERIDEACTATHAAPHTVGLLYLDLDGFKNVNDTFGHHIGDALLIEVARRLHECVRGGDTVARMGGDEFVVLCPDLDTPARLNTVAQRVLARLGAPYELAGRYVNTVTASVGLSYPLVSTDPTDALRAADQAMYRAKTSGKNRIGLHLADEPDGIGGHRSARSA